MSQYNSLRATIDANIKTNNNEEITGAVLNSVLKDIVNSLGAHHQVVGVANASTSPGTPDQRVAYLAAPGTYQNFGNISVPAGCIGVFIYDSAWTSETIPVVEIVNNLSSGGSAKALSAEQGKLLSAAVSAVQEYASSLEEETSSEIASLQLSMSTFEDTIRDIINEYAPITITGNVTNAPDEEDITSDANHLLKFKNRSALNGLGFVILRRGQSFADQVTLPNTIYEVRYNFNLSGESITIPAGCSLNFTGGKLTNGTLVLADTELINPRLDVRISGTSRTKRFLASWFVGSSFSSYISDVLNIPGTQLVFDKDVSMSDFASANVNHISIDGCGHSVVNMPRFNVGNCDIDLRDIRITYTATPEDGRYYFVYKDVDSYTGKYNTLNLHNVMFDGGNVFRGFIVVSGSADSDVSYLADIQNCSIKNLLAYGLYLRCEVMGIVANCVFSHIGFEGDVGDETLHSAIGMLLGDNNRYADESNLRGKCHDATIEGNYLSGIVGSYYGGTSDERELHGILCYGDNITIRNNRVMGLSTSFSGIYDTGKDAEAIYLKGRNSHIDGNLVVDGCGADSNAAITAKIDTQRNNYIINNVIIHDNIPAKSIMLGGANGVIEGNTIIQRAGGAPYSIELTSAVSCVIRNNKISAPNGTHYLLLRGVVEMIGNIISDMQELSIGSGDANLVCVGNDISFKSNLPTARLFRFRDSSYIFTGNRIRVDGLYEFNRFVTASNLARCVFEKNTFEFSGLTITRLFSGGGEWHVSDNVFRFVSCTIGAIPLIYMPGSGECLRNIVVGAPAITPPGAIVSDIGTSTNRPTGIPAGFQYFDVTLGIPIFWTGSGWVDSAGGTI